MLVTALIVGGVLVGLNVIAVAMWPQGRRGGAAVCGVVAAVGGAGFLAGWRMAADAPLFREGVSPIYS